MPPAPAKRGYDPYADVSRAQDLAREGVMGYGESLRPGLEREIGNALGGLNEIGALRSGGSTVALRDISTDYAQQVGAYAKMAAGEAVGHGLEAGRIRLQRDEANRKRKSGLLSAIGSVLGAGIGFIAGGPGGAVAGAKIGSGLGGSDERYEGSYG